MDLDKTPLWSQKYLFGCEPKAHKDYHLKVDNDENEHHLSFRRISLGAGAKERLHTVEAEVMNYEGSPIKVTLATLKMSVQPTLWRKTQSQKRKRKKLLSISEKSSVPGSDDDDDDFDDEEILQPKIVQKSIQNAKESKEKTPKTLKGPSSTENIKAKMQASIEKGGSLPKGEAKFINYVKNCFRMTDQEAIQDLWQRRESL
ncbi:unnamed protein product [Nyctereutes procyonoides]|uniref:Nucleophosmin n=1 Tax=Nyctereutes procyonoides TaxID=34880 RepID=A0A811Z8M4_NYCPR|nr:unnamed protein product [Nyctereutes procyonoides]